MAGQVVGMGPRIGGLLMGPGKHAFFKSGIARPEGPKVTRKFARGFCARTRLTSLGGGGGSRPWKNSAEASRCGSKCG